MSVKPLKRPLPKPPQGGGAGFPPACFMANEADSGKQDGFNAPAIQIANRQRTKKINPRLLKQITEALLAELQVESVQLGINLVSAAEMARVNWQFLRHEGSTDVITFDHGAEQKARSASPKKIHGELFISMDDAVAQAREFKCPWRSEVVRYVVHGVLHLLGHDDLKAPLRRKMKRQENRMLQRLEKNFPVARL
jgi:probable rRNA maturation factor